MLGGRGDGAGGVDDVNQVGQIVEVGHLVRVVDVIRAGGTIGEGQVVHGDSLTRVVRDREGTGGDGEARDGSERDKKVWRGRTGPAGVCVW